MNLTSNSIFENLKSDVDQEFLDKYISHYNKILEWFNQHEQNIQRINFKPLYNQFNFGYPRSNLFSSSFDSKLVDNSDNENEENYNNHEGYEDKVDIEMELTPEMAEFFKKSAEHRKYRDEQKHVVRNFDDMHKFEKEYQDLSKVTSFQRTPTIETPRVRPNHTRSLDMQRLYGEAGSQMIVAMETAIQLSFNRNRDRHQAKHWPALPINIQFA